MAGFPTGWKTVWLFAMFDLPSKTPEERRDYTLFRRDLLADGFTMMQYSVYTRFCSSPENAETHIARMSAGLPPEGEVRFFLLTDKQFEKMRIFWGKERQEGEKSPSQLEFF